MPTESGYSNQKKKGLSQFKTINQVGSGQYGNPISQKTVFDLTPAAIAITAVTDIEGSDGQVEFWQITLPSHSGLKNDIFRIISGTLLAWEYDIIQVIDNDNFYILPISDVKPQIADTAKVLRWVTSKSSQEGELVVVVAPSPVAYVLDGVDTEAEVDTATPANSRGIPVTQLNADGTLFNPQVFSDILTDTNTLAAIDFATETTLAAILADTASLDIKDFATETTLALLAAKDFATETTLAALAAEDFATEVTLAAILADTASLDGKDFATEATLALLAAEDFATEVTLAAILADTASLDGKDFATETTLNLILSDTISLVGKDFATEITLTSLAAKDFATEASLSGIATVLPATIGQKANAAALGVSLSTEQEVILGAIKTAVETSATSSAALVPTYQEIVNLTNIAQTFTAPAGAKWAKIMADDSNAANLRVKIGGVATTTSGMQFQPGRSEDYSAVGDISVICSTADTNQKIYVQFGA